MNRRDPYTSTLVVIAVFGAVVGVLVGQFHLDLLPALGLGVVGGLAVGLVVRIVTQRR